MSRVRDQCRWWKHMLLSKKPAQPPSGFGLQHCLSPACPVKTGSGTGSDGEQGACEFLLQNANVV